jgi:hypothetical protein
MVGVVQRAELTTSVNRSRDATASSSPPPQFKLGKTIDRWNAALKRLDTFAWFSSGICEVPLMTVEGSPVRFPLDTAACRSLLQDAQIAPFGAGTETIIDESVRKAKQIDPSQISFDKSWDKQLTEITRELEAAYQTKKGDLSLVFYKMLVYEEGTPSYLSYCFQ